jgi:arginyl-tRNA synthetase
MVALTPETALQLQPGLELSEDERRRAWVDMSGRRGIGVKADDLLDRLEQKSLDEVLQRNAELPRDEQAGLARAIAVGALRYYMLRFAKNTVVAFDIDEALAFEGETGPYCQYAAVRVARIVDRLAEKLGTTPDAVRRDAEAASFDALPADSAAEHWELVHRAARLPEAVRQAVATLEFSILSRYAFDLAQAINGFYHRHQVGREPSPAVRSARLAVLLAADGALRRALALMGVTVPARM